MTTLVISHSTHLSYIFWGGLGTRMYTTIVLMRCDGDGLSPIQLESLKDFQNARHCKEAFIAIPTDSNNYEVGSACRRPSMQIAAKSFFIFIFKSPRSLVVP